MNTVIKEQNILDIKGLVMNRAILKQIELVIPQNFSTFEKDDNVEGLGHVIAPREHPDYFIFKYKNSNKLYKFIIKHTGYRNTYPQIFVV